MGSNQLVRTKSQSLRDRGTPSEGEGAQERGRGCGPGALRVVGRIAWIEREASPETRVKAINE